MGERQSWLFEPSFNRTVKVRAASDRLTSDAGVLLLREVDHRLGLVESLASSLRDPRRQHLIRYTLSELLRERVYAMAQGYSAQDDLDRLAHDPAFKMAVWDRPGDVLRERLASQPTQSRLVSILSAEDNRAALHDALAESLRRFLRVSGPDRPVRRMTIDLDSFPVVVHGEQVGGAYNGYYKDTIYHPIVASACVEGRFDSSRRGGRFGNGFIGAKLRPGNTHTSNGALDYLKELVPACRRLARHFSLRLDAGFMIGSILDWLTEEKVRFVGRLKTNSRLDALAEPHLTRPPGRPPKKGYLRTVELGRYSAKDWKHPQRLILVVVDKPGQDGLLFDMPEYFFLVTNYPPAARSGVEMVTDYRGRGTFEDRVGEFNQVLGPHLSQSSFGDNETTLLLALLSFNLSSFLRLELEEGGGGWDLGRFRDSVLKAGGRVVRHGRRLVLYLASAVVRFWSRLSDRLERWTFPETLPRRSGPTRRDWIPPPAHAHQALVLRG